MIDSEISDKAKSVGKAKRAVDELAKAKPAGDLEALPLFEKTIGALRGVSDSGLIETLEEKKREIQARVEDALSLRREDLRRAARDAGWKTDRFQNYDRVGCFRVEYRRARVTMYLGSEKLDGFDEGNGQALFSRIEKAKAALDDFPFSRDGFFAAIKAALSLAKAGNANRDGKTPIRTIYPLTVLARQSLDNAFMKRPEGKNFKDYSLCQFVYDMARFGRDGWIMPNGERLSSQTPNMATVARGATIAVPDLSVEGRATQIAALWIQRA